MAISDAYATAEEYRAAIDMTSTSQDAEILTNLKAISRYLDGKLGRHFTKDATDQTRVYVPQRSYHTLRVDDMSAAPTSIKLDIDGDGTCETTLESTDYEVLPRNAALMPEPRPYTQIRMSDWGNYAHFPAGCRVEVTAQFGWPAIPDGVKLATIHLAALLRIESPRATRRIPELGDTIEATPDAMSIVRQLTDDYQVIHYA